LQHNASDWKFNQAAHGYVYLLHPLYASKDS
jgi:hypothetical protein